MSYQRRDAVLKEIGFNSYKEYLESPLWGRIRSQAMRRNKYRCKKCGDWATCIHHKAYDKGTMLGKCAQSLAPLCFCCHEFIEYDHTGKKMSLHEANERLKTGYNPNKKCFHRKDKQRIRKRTKYNARYDIRPPGDYRNVKDPRMYGIDRGW